MPGQGAVGACLSTTAEPGQSHSWLIAYPAGTWRPDGYSAVYYVDRPATTFSWRVRHLLVFPCASASSRGRPVSST